MLSSAYIAKNCSYYKLWVRGKALWGEILKGGILHDPDFHTHLSTNIGKVTQHGRVRHGNLRRVWSGRPSGWISRKQSLGKTAAVSCAYRRRDEVQTCATNTFARVFPRRERVLLYLKHNASERVVAFLGWCIPQPFCFPHSFRKTRYFSGIYINFTKQAENQGNNKIIKRNSQM